MSMSISGRATARVFAAATAALMLGAVATTSAGATTAPAEFQLTINTSAPNSSPLHTIRSANGSWTAWDQVPDYYYNPVGTDSLTQAESGGQLDLASEGAGQIQFVIWNDATASWSSPTGTTAPISSTVIPVATCGIDCAPAPTISQLVGSVVLGTDFHLFGLGSDGYLYEAVRSADGSWTNWTSTGLTPVGSFTEVSVATTSGGDTQIAAIMDGKLYLTSRTTPTGSFSSWTDVFSVSSDPGTPNHVAIAGVDGNLQVLVSVDNGAGLYHALRSSAGSAGYAWTVFGNVEAATGSNPGTIDGIAMGASGESSTADVMEFALVNSAGAVYHGLRNTNGSWTAMGNVIAQVGSLGSGTTATSVAAGAE